MKTTEFFIQEYKNKFPDSSKDIVSILIQKLNIKGGGAEDGNQCNI